MEEKQYKLGRGSAFKYPNFKAKEQNKLKDGIASMENALQRGERQPWNKHEFA